MKGSIFEKMAENCKHDRNIIYMYKFYVPKRIKKG